MITVANKWVAVCGRSIGSSEYGIAVDVTVGVMRLEFAANALVRGIAWNIALRDTGRRLKKEA